MKKIWTDRNTANNAIIQIQTMRKNLHPDIEHRVAETLNVLDGIAPASPRPYFYSRLRARMERGTADKAGAAWPAPAHLRWVLAGVILLILLNTFTALRYMGGLTQDPDIAAELISEYYDDALTPDNLQTVDNQ
jgi:hypothetical protein